MSDLDKHPFAQLGLGPVLSATTERLGFTEPTPIQARALPALLAGRDVVGLARTGSGKTAAFGLPLIERLAAGGGGSRALVLTPTRELALQVSKALRDFAEGVDLQVTTIYGGAPFAPQMRELAAGADIVVGTPGRVLDHFDRGTLKLENVEVLVLDEADEMLRMGFIDDVERIIAATPETRQVALFSATMPPPIRRIAKAHLKQPVELQVESEAMAVDHVDQRWVWVPEKHKADAVARLLELEEATGALVFARTRSGCAAVADALARAGVSVDAIHGDLPQAARERVLERLRAKRIDVLVATDVAARGIDVDHLTLVINHDLPMDLESYVHRIGRTGRAGREGKAISLVTPPEVRRLKAFEHRLGVPIAEVKPPSEGDIARARWARLRRELSAELETEGAPTASPAIERVMAELKRNDATPEAMVAAALRVLARVRDLPLAGERDEAPPVWARNERAVDRSPAPRRERVERDANVDEAEIFLPIGKSRGVRPADLVGAIAGDLGIAGSLIGRITVLQHKSFVSLPRELVGKMLRARARIQVRGSDVPVVASNRPSGQPAGHHPSGHHPSGRAGGHGAPKRGERPSPSRAGAKRPAPAPRPERPRPAKGPAKKRPGPSRSSRSESHDGWIV